MHTNTSFLFNSLIQRGLVSFRSFKCIYLFPWTVECVICVAILLHKKDGDIFLWPAIWQQPKDVVLMGILGEADISYDEIPGSQTPTLKIKDKEVKTSWVMVKDYRLASAPVVGCWLVPFQALTQRELSDFTITQL